MANEGRLVRITSSDVASTAALGVNLTNAEIAAKLEAGNLTFAAKSGVSPRGICTDYSGNMYISDYSAHVIYKMDEGGRISVFAGEAGTAGINGTLTNVAALSARFTNPLGLACDKSGNVYVADTGNNQIRVIREGRVSHVAGDGAGVAGSTDGVGGAAKFTTPMDVAVDAKGVVYVADTGNNCIRRVTDGTVYTFAGSTVAGDKEDVAVTREAIFSGPYSLTIDANGNIYVCDTGNYKVKMITPNGWVYRHSGSGVAGKVLGTTAFNCRYNSLVASSVDRSGNIYVIDVNAGAGSRLIRISRTGIPSVVNDFTGATDVNSTVISVAFSPAGKMFVLSHQ